MLRHRPEGSGHPYSVDTEQRSPVTPLVGERVLLGVRASTSEGSHKFTDSLEPVDFLGGFLNLSGHAERSLIGDQSALGRAVAYDILDSAW